MAHSIFAFPRPIVKLYNTNNGIHTHVQNCNQLAARLNRSPDSIELYLAYKLRTTLYRHSLSHVNTLHGIYCPETITRHLTDFVNTLVLCPACSSQFTYLYQSMLNHTKFLHCTECSAQTPICVSNKHVEHIVHTALAASNAKRTASDKHTKHVSFDPVVKIFKVYNHEQIKHLEKVPTYSRNNPFLAILNLKRTKLIKNND